MADPIIGMDPYLESQGYWPDFHHRFVVNWCDAIADRLPDNYEARINERWAPAESPATASASPVGAVTLQPVTIPRLIDEPMRETYIEILHRPERSLVAVLELLSPANKEVPGRTLYLAKRHDTTAT